MKKIVSILCIFILVISCSGCGIKNSSKKINIIAVNFPCYDFARGVVKNSKDVSLRMLLKPGTESHTYEPTPKDIIDIENSDMFIYVGGESDSWVDNILKDIDTKKTRIIKLTSVVSLYDEEKVEGMETEEEEVEKDEHVWTSPINAIKIVKEINEVIKKIDSKNSSLYDSNTKSYVSELESIDSGIREVVSKSSRKELIFGDRFPLLYFVKEYGLSYYAAFPGCSEDTEANANTISFLVKKVKSDNIPVVLTIELSNKKIAKTIASETKTKILTFNSCHNISSKDFNDGVTYVDLMKENISVLSEALN